jgi:hypothetical protein
VGRPINSKYMGPIPSTTSTKHLYFNSAWVPGAPGPEQNTVFIIKQTGTGHYKASDGVFEGAVTLVNASAGIPVQIVTAAAVTTGGSSYQVGDVLFISGGTFYTAAILKVLTLGGGGAVATAMVINAGNYTMVPTNPVSVTGGHGTLATFTLVFGPSVSASAPGQAIMDVTPYGGLPTEYAAVVNQDNVKTFQDHVYDWSTTLAFAPRQANLPLA